MKTSLILACAGKGVRAGFDKNKLLVEFDGKPCFEHTFEVFFNSNLFEQIILTASKQDFDYIKGVVGNKAQVVEGGATRTQSIKNALQLVEGDIVLIHDGARPFISLEMIENCIETTKKFGSAIPVIPSRNTMVKTVGEKVENYLGKDGLCAVQTPQGFNTNQIKHAYACAGTRAFNDDGEVYKEYIGELHTYQGEEKNLKLTFKEDFNACKQEFRVGVGFDCHKLVENRALILGGIKIEHSKGLLGHSDADVLTHAIMDALLSSLSLRDIGYHFSDKDPKYKDADSMALLEKVLAMIDQNGYKPHNISATIMAEKPKLLKIIPLITENLASALSLPVEKVGIGATTLEGLGFVGREEGICVHATATVVKK